MTMDEELNYIRRKLNTLTGQALADFEAVLERDPDQITDQLNNFKDYLATLG
jgi:hypothetical protein